MSEPVPFFIAQCDEAGKVTWERASQVSGYLRKKFAGKTIEVEFREYRDKRSDLQNRALWALLSEWARHGGHNVNDLKDDVMGEVWGWSETASPLSGRKVPTRARTSKLNVPDFCLLIERILEIAAECGVWLQAPQEYREAKEKALKLAAKKSKAA